MRAKVAIVAGFALVAAAPAWAQAPAQNRAEPWRGPYDPEATQASANRARTTSGPAAVQPTAAEQKAARALAAAIFAKPAAGQRAAENAAPDVAPDGATVAPRPEWTEPPPGVAPGGRGVRISKPF
jgi:hypothetical protein